MTDKEYFIVRTKAHIKKVIRWYNYLSPFFPKIETINITKHDQSKFSCDLIQGYILLTKYKRDSFNDEASSEEQKIISKATKAHIYSEFHHPECWSSNDVKPMNVSNMPDYYILEMMADWFAMSEELNNNPQDWYNKTVGVKWEFTESQKEIMLKCINLYYIEGK